MTVQEILDLLNKVEDKSKEIGVAGDGFGGSYDDINGVEEDADGVYIKIA